MAERALPVTILEPAGIDPALLDHSLNLRFDLGQFDDRITFTRNSTATYFGSDGLLKTASANEPRIDHDPVTGECKGFLVEEARTNLLTYSEQFDSAVWSKSFSTVTLTNEILSPTGAANAYKIVRTSNVQPLVLRRSGLSLPAGTTYSASIYIYVPEQSGVTSWLMTNDYMDIESGSTPTYTVFNKWVRVSTTSTLGAERNIIDFNMRVNDTQNPPVGFVFYIWGAQLEANAFPTSYIPTPATFTSRNSTATYFNSTGVMLTAAINEPRYDHGYVNGQWVSKGLVLENSATNLLTYSEQFDNAAWVKTNATVIANAVVAPDGTLSGDKLVENTAAADHSNRQPATAAPGITYTFSCYLKAGERTQGSLEIFTGAAVYKAVFNLVTGAFLSSTGAGSYVVTPVGNGWFRFAITAVASTTTLNGFVYTASGGITNYTGDGTSGIYVWGAQLEAGSQPTSYIKTEATTITRAADLSTSSTVTRAADSAVMTGSNFSSWYRQDEGTMFAEVNIRQTRNDNTFAFSVSNSAGIADNRWTLLFESTPNVRAQALRNTNAAGLLVTGTTNSYTVGVNKAALAISQGASVVLNGGTARTTTTYAAPNVNQLQIGNQSNNGYTNGHIARLAYYPKRLSDTQLQALTS